MIGSGKKEGWPECFQDLGSWCSLPQDELHTPKFNIQDEFNFSIDDGHANDWDLSSPGDLHCEPWGNDTQFGISSCQPVIGEINSPLLQERTPLGVISNTPNLLGSGGKILYTITQDDSRSPLKSKKNVLLSQGIVKTVSDDSTFLSMAATEHKTNNPIIITNDIRLLPITVPDFASAKLNSSSLSTSFLSPPLQSPSPTPPPAIKKISTLRQDTLSGTLLQQTRLENVHIKEEEQGLDDSFRVPAGSNDGVLNEVELVPVKQSEKPQLKLNIAAANSVSKFSASTLNTPEVLRPLVDGDSKEFNLLQYVCNDGEYSGLSQEVEEDSDRNVGDQAIRDHDYTDSWPTSDIKSDVVIKSEPGSPASTSCSTSNRSTSKGRARRKRRRDDSSDYVVSDSDQSVSDDSQQEWSPTPAKKRTRRKSSTYSTKTSGKTGTGGKRTGGGRRSSQASGQATPASGGQDKYRALRERNNEASRRSRMNRKQRDVEMLQFADDLHRKNVSLKARAEKMENLVKYMRAEIMKALTKPK